MHTDHSTACSCSQPIGDPKLKGAPQNPGCNCTKTRTGRRSEQRTALQHISLLLLLTASVWLLPSVKAVAGAKWTILVYMLADNDLECFGVDDMTVSPAGNQLQSYDAIVYAKQIHNMWCSILMCIHQLRASTAPAMACVAMHNRCRG